MFDTIKGIIGDIAAGAIKDQRIQLSQEQLTALDAKLREALSENENLSQRVTELEGLVAERDAKIAQLQPSADLDPFAFDILNSSLTSRAICPQKMQQRSLASR
jgi:hypothetical protein